MAEPTELEGRATSCQPAGPFLSWTMTRHDFENALCFIFDIDLNGESGFELCRCLVDKGVRLPVIYITGNDSEANRAAAIESGCIAYLTKPFAALSLIEPIEKVRAAA